MISVDEGMDSQKLLNIGLMKISPRLIGSLSAILITALGGFGSSWLFIQYQQPQIVCYSDGYYSKINDLLIGSIFIVNEGRSPETNLSISISEKILKADIAVDYLSTKAEILNDGNETRITIPKLKPHEYTEIVFRSRMANENFKIGDITSDSGNIRYEEWMEKSWRDFSKFQLGIILLVITVAFGVGCLIGLITGRHSR